MPWNFFQKVRNLTLQSLCVHTGSRNFTAMLLKSLICIVLAPRAVHGQMTEWPCWKTLYTRCSLFYIYEAHNGKTSHVKKRCGHQLLQERSRGQKAKWSNTSLWRFKITIFIPRQVNVPVQGRIYEHRWWTQSLQRCQEMGLRCTQYLWTSLHTSRIAIVASTLRSSIVTLRKKPILASPVTKTLKLAMGCKRTSAIRSSILPVPTVIFTKTARFS